MKRERERQNVIQCKLWLHVWLRVIFWYKALFVLTSLSYTCCPIGNVLERREEKSFLRPKNSRVAIFFVTVFGSSLILTFTFWYMRAWSIHVHYGTSPLSDVPHLSFASWTVLTSYPCILKVLMFIFSYGNGFWYTKTLSQVHSLFLSCSLLWSYSFCHRYHRFLHKIHWLS